jgi:hypothetical protein
MCICRFLRDACIDASKELRVHFQLPLHDVTHYWTENTGRPLDLEGMLYLFMC